jgi:hypothetical protein
MLRQLYNNLIFERQKKLPQSSPGTKVGTIGLRRNRRPGHNHAMMFQQSQFKNLIQKVDVTIFFSGEKHAFLDSLPKSQNMDSYYFCNTLLAGVKTGACAGTQKAILRDFHIHMDNCKVHNSKLTKEKLHEIRLIRWDHPPYLPYIARSDFWFFGWSKREMNGQAFSSREAVKTLLLEMRGRMDFGQLFNVFNKWIKRLEYVIESGGEYYTKKNALL